MGQTLLTKMGSYKDLNTLAAASSLDTEPAAATGFAVGAVSGEINLQANDGAGDQTEANGIVIILEAAGAADGDAVVHALYGRSDNGPLQKLGELTWTIGTARVDASTATFLWADTCVVVGTHINVFTVADGGGSDRVCSVAVDAGGFKYLKGYFITGTNAGLTDLKASYRHW